MKVEDQQLEAFLLDSALVEKKALKEARREAKKAGKRLADILLAQGLLSQEEITKMETYILGIPFVDLKGQKLDFEVLSLIPEPIARTHNIIAFKKTENALEVAMLDTQDLSAIDFVSKKTLIPLQILLILLH